MSVRFRLASEQGPFRHTGEVVSTARGETDIWYTIRDNATGREHTLPWHMVEDKVKVALAQLDGTAASAVSLLSGLSVAELDDLGGF